MLKLKQKPKTVPEFKEVLQLIWSAILKKVIDNVVKDNRKRLQECVSVSGGHFEHIILIVIFD